MSKWLPAVLLLGVAYASEYPFSPDETLHYSVNWPSGLGLGDAIMSVKLAKSPTGEPAGWEFEFRIDAAVPGFSVVDHYRSSTTKDLCSIEFEKVLAHGRRKGQEKTTFSGGTASRKTKGGGKSDIPVDECAKDGLAYLYFLRHELAQGRIPSPQKVLFGAAYEVSFQYGGTQQVAFKEERINADKISATVKGPASKFTFELVVAQDPARTPVRIKVPLELGDFSMELAPQ
jgi:hypothetical protein